MTALPHMLVNMNEANRHVRHDRKYSLCIFLSLFSFVCFLRKGLFFPTIRFSHLTKYGQTYLTVNLQQVWRTDVEVHVRH